MQSLNDLRALAFVDRDLIEERATRFAHCRASADTKKLMSILSENAVYSIPGDPTQAPRFRRHEGSAAILQFLSEHHINYQMLNLQNLDVIIDGDRAAVRSRGRLRHRGTGRSQQIDICDVVRFENGYIVEIHSYMDTLAMSVTRECGA